MREDVERCGVGVGGRIDRRKRAGGVWVGGRGEVGCGDVLVRREEFGDGGFEAFGHGDCGVRVDYEESDKAGRERHCCGLGGGRIAFRLLW